jgi:hypothetical protein
MSTSDPPHSHNKDGNFRMPDVDFDDEIGRWIAFQINPRLAAHCSPNPGIPVPAVKSL